MKTCTCRIHCIVAHTLMTLADYSQILDALPYVHHIFMSSLHHPATLKGSHGLHVIDFTAEMHLPCLQLVLQSQQVCIQPAIHV